MFKNNYLQMPKYFDIKKKYVLKTLKKLKKHRLHLDRNSFKTVNYLYFKSIMFIICLFYFKLYKTTKKECIHISTCSKQRHQIFKLYK